MFEDVIKLKKKESEKSTNVLGKVQFERHVLLARPLD